MKTKRTIEFEVEKNSFFIRRTKQSTLSAWCIDCNSQSQMVTPDEAALWTGVSARAIYQRVEAGAVHFVEAPDGNVLVCLNSLRLRQAD